MSSIHPEVVRLAARIRRAVVPLSRKLRPRLQRDGISTGKLSLVGHLSRHGPVTPTELAGHEGVKLQSLTRMLAELEVDGWVLREAHPSDGRQSLLTLTRSGAKRLADAVHTNDDLLAQIIASACSPADRAVLRRACSLLDAFADALAASAGGAQPVVTPSSVARPSGRPAARAAAQTAARPVARSAAATMGRANRR
jgi:DNA-binding MarR family transcriptional regulator